MKSKTSKTSKISVLPT